MNIQEIDQQILTLFKKRIDLKNHYNDENINEDTMHLFERLMLMNNQENKPLSDNWKWNFSKYKTALMERRQPISHPRVVYQGEPGAYSEMAARDFFGKEVQTKGLYQFKDAFEALRNHTADYAVLPIENSSTGAIRQVYDLLTQYECYMVGETTVNVKHNLMGLPGAKLEDIQTVYSHEQGLFQCEEYLNAHPQWHQVPQADTAGSAKMVASSHDRSKAAICSSRAAEIYGLEIIVEEINTNTNNTTRFVVVSPKMELRPHCDKICMSITTAHHSGSLQEVLTIFAIHGLNLVRLESRPIQERNWEYMFFIEFTGYLLASDMDEIIKQLSKTVNEMKIFGNFPSNLE